MSVVLIKKQKLPITYDILEKMQPEVLKLKDGAVIWSAMTLAFFGCLRASELTNENQSTFNPEVHICVSDVTVNGDPEYISVLIKRSKTDRSNQGFRVYLGCTHCSVCAHCAIKSIVDKCSTSPTSTPLFRFSNRVVLSKNIFVTQTLTNAASSLTVRVQQQ